MLLESPKDLCFETVGSLADVDPAEWDRLAGRRVLASYGWLRTLEETHINPPPCRYILARNGLGLVGAVACQIHARKSEAFDLDDALFGRLAKVTRRIGLSVMPAVVCGSLFGVTEAVIVRVGTPAGECQTLMRQLVEAVERMAAGSGWGVCFRGVAEMEPFVAGMLLKRGYLRTRELPVACLELSSGWSRFSDYRHHLKKIHPRTAKGLCRELNRARRAGLAIEQIEEPAQLSERLHGLLNAHCMRLNGRPFPFGPELFERLKSRLGGRAVIYAARLGRELVGASIALRDDDAAYLPMIGVDPERGRASATYFNLGYNRPIEDSLAAGHRHVYFGRMLYLMKARRGCLGLEMELFFRGRNAIHTRLLRPVFALRALRIASISAALPPRAKRQPDEPAPEEV